MASNSFDYAYSDSKMLSILSRQASELSDTNKAEFEKFVKYNNPNVPPSTCHNLFEDLKVLRDVRGDADHPEKVAG